MRIAILGGGGMLARDLAGVLAGRHEVLPLPREAADLRDPALAERLRSVQPEVVVNCAAATDVDRCELEPAWAYAVNAEGAGRAAAAAAALGARFIQISTDFVFSGEGGAPYAEEDAPEPVNVYGASKLAGEKAVLQAGGRVAIVRTASLYGRHGRSFPRTILNAPRRAPERPLRVVADQYVAPTYTRHLAHKLEWVLEAAPDRSYHITNAGECTRYEWARELLRCAGLERVPVIPITAAEWPAPAPRPQRSTLRRGALEALGADDMPGWQQGVAEFVEELRAAGELGNT